MSKIYDISILNGVFVVTNINTNIKEAQFHTKIDCYTYEPNLNLGTPANLKLVEKYGDEIELDINNVFSISSVPFVGTFDDLKTEITSLTQSLEKIELELIEGFNVVGSGLPNGVWNNIQLDLSTANKIVLIHAYNSASPNTSRSVGVRTIGEAGIMGVVGGRSTTAYLVKSNENAQIEARQLGNGVIYRHMNTFK